MTPSTTTTDDRPYTAETLAERWQCSKSHIYKMIERGTLAPIRLGKLVRIPAAEVERIECGHDCIEGSSTRSGQTADALDAPHSAPRIVQLPSSAFDNSKRSP